VFVVEMELKIIGLGVREYCSDRFNIFDGTIVILSTIEIILFYTGAGGSITTGGAISAFRAFRLLRALRLARSWKSLRRLLDVISKTVSGISYFSILMMLFMFIYALLGMELFAYYIKFDGKYPRENFNDLLHAVLSIYIFLVGDDWQYIMYNAIRT
jgi:voltage-dependent calcium channel L type alpha-1D